MNPSPCRLLEDYLVHDLQEADQVEFLAHLDHCFDCRRTVSEQRELDSLLVQSIGRLEPIPSRLTKRIERRLKVRQQHRFLAVGMVLVTTAFGILLLCRATIDSWHRSDPPLPEVLQGPTSQDSPIVLVTFPRSADVVAIREKTDSPNITFIWVYWGRRALPVPSSREVGRP